MQNKMKILFYPELVLFELNCQITLTGYIFVIYCH